MRILYLIGREIEYPRNDILLRALRRFSDVDVIGVSKRPKSLIINSLMIIVKSLHNLRNTNYDLIFIGFYGQLIIPVIGSFVRTPILFDAFISTYDTLILDRKLFPQQSILALRAQ